MEWMSGWIHSGERVGLGWWNKSGWWMWEWKQQLRATEDYLAESDGRHSRETLEESMEKWRRVTGDTLGNWERRATLLQRAMGDTLEKSFHETLKDENDKLSENETQGNEDCVRNGEWESIWEWEHGRVRAWESRTLEHIPSEDIGRVGHCKCSTLQVQHIASPAHTFSGWWKSLKVEVWLDLDGRMKFGHPG